MAILIDSNVLIDIFTQDKEWFSWSSKQLEYYANEGKIYINPIIYSEISICFQCIEDLESALPSSYILRDAIPYEASFLAGKCFVEYRQRGGSKTSPLPDFLIGAHAAVKEWTLITRDKGRYKTYFPYLNLITP